jgi:hypothetical protein
MRRASVLLLLLSCAEPETGIRREPVVRNAEDERLSVTTTSAGIVVRGPGPEREDFRPECEPGMVQECTPAPISPEGSRRRRALGRVAYCVLDTNGAWRWNRASCWTPLVLAFDDAPVVFTKPAVGATEWVSARTPWIALDEDRSGCVESEDELFGPAEDGFPKLARLDANGDGRVDARDPAFDMIIVWGDANQDRACTRDEVRTLGEMGITSLATAWTAPATIPFGSYEGERGTFFFEGKRGRIIDVYLAPLR